MEIGILRLVHITAGAIWAGFAFFIGWYLMPALKAAGPAAAGAVMGNAMGRKLPVVMNLAAFLVFVTGIRLYMLSFSVPWLTTPLGISLTIGAVLAIGGGAIGSFVSRPVGVRLGQLSAQIQAKGGPPTPEQVAELQQLSARGGRAGMLVAWHLLGTVVCMAGSRLFALM